MNAEDKQHLLRDLPSLSSLLSAERGLQLQERYGEGMFKYECRRQLDAAREALRSGRLSAAPTLEVLFEGVARELHRKRDPEARHAINATGILLHTNLGRAPIGEHAKQLLSASSGFGVVQINLQDNSRSKRDEEIASLLQTLTNCESATVVNNNAAATFMLISVIASGKEVIISRGQLVEIGGSYRMPDVMAQSGAILREVGTTNRTHLSDYEKAIGPETGAILYVDPSNYQVIGFAGTPSLADLCALGKKYHIPVIADLGSGALVPTSCYGIKDSLSIQEALAVGATVTCSSGDKLIGGPQAGIICGAAEVVDRVRKSPFARMFRVDKLTLSGIEATLQEFVNGTYEESIPLYAMLSRSIQDLQANAESLQGAWNSAGLACQTKSTQAYVGGGSLPSEALPSVAVVLHSFGPSAETAAKELRLHVPPIFCRIEENALVFDVRSLLPGDLEKLARIVPEVCGPLAAGRA